MKTKLLYIISLFCFLSNFTQASASGPVLSDSTQMEIWVKEGVQQLNGLIKQNAQNEALGRQEENTYVFSIDPADRFIFEEAREEGNPSRDFGYDPTKDDFLDLNASLKGFNTNAQLNPKGIKFYVCLTSRFEAFYSIPTPDSKTVQDRIEKLEQLQLQALATTGDISGEDQVSRLEQNISEQKAIHTKFTELFQEILARSELKESKETILLSVALTGYYEKKNDKLLKVKAVVGGYQFKGTYVEELQEDFKQKVPFSLKEGSRFQALQSSLSKAFAYLRDKAVMPDVEGPGEAFYNQYFTSASESEKKEIIEIRDLYNRMGEALLDGYTQEAWAAQKPYYQVYYDGYGEWGYTYEQYREALEAYLKEFEEYKEQLSKVDKQDRAVLLLARLSDSQVLALPLSVRLKALKALASESMIGYFNLRGKDEEGIGVRLIKHTPHDQLTDFHTELFKVKIGDKSLFLKLIDEYNDLEVFGGDGNSGVLAQIFTAQKIKLIGEDFDQEKKLEQVEKGGFLFVWNGRAGKVEAGNAYNIYESSFGSNGNLNFRFGVWHPNDWAQNQEQYYPSYHPLNEWIALYPLKEIKLGDELVLQANQPFLAPAILLHVLIQEEHNLAARQGIYLTIDAASLLIGVGELQAGAKGVRFIAALVEVIASTADVTLTAMEPQILKMEGGQEFLNKTRSLTLIANLSGLGVISASKLAQRAPGQVEEIVGWWKANKATIAENISDPTGINRYNEAMEELSRFINRSDWGNLIDELAELVEESYRASFRVDLADEAFRLKIAERPELIGSWKVLHEARVTELSNKIDDIKFVDDYLKKNPEKTGTVADDIKNKGWQNWVDDLNSPIRGVDELFAAIKNEPDFQGFRNLCLNNPKVTVELAGDDWMQFASEVKSTYGIGRKRNLAKIEFEGKEYLIASGKGYNSQMTNSNKFLPESFVLDVESGKRIFEPSIETRHLDTESVGLEYFAKHHNAVKGGKYSNVTGKLKLTSDLCPCPSCSAIFQQFSDMFPNVTIDIITTTKLHY